MSVTINNRAFGYDNISAGNAYGGELPTVGNVTINENISAGNAAPLNEENGTGSTGIPASASGTEIP